MEIFFDEGPKNFFTLDHLIGVVKRTLFVCVIANVKKRGRIQRRYRVLTLAVTYRANVAASVNAPLLLIITATRARVAASTSDGSALDRRRRWILSVSC